MYLSINGAADDMCIVLYINVCSCFQSIPLTGAAPTPISPDPHSDEIR